MDRKGSGIKIYRESRRGKTGRKDRLSEVFFFSIAVSCLAAAWMNAFLSVYFASGALGKMPALKKIASLVIAAGSFVFLAGISAFAGKYLDAGREVEGSFYQATRETIRTDLIGGIERMVRGAEEEDLQEIEKDASSEADETVGENTVAPEGEESPGAEIFGDTPAASEGSMDHLKEISSYQPDPMAYSSIVVVTKRPTDTVYVHSRTGIIYTGGSWERGEYPGAVLVDGTEYMAYPPELDRLEELCRDWDRSSAQAVGRQIDEVFSAMAVYDVNPGPTPGDQDFAEYFLFENHKGFCVHFATTAALLYRMCGYPSVYIEGYAVPASAFEQMEDGSYQARIDGSMGHAWCRVYDEREGWENREHTPAAPGRTEEMPEEDKQADEQAEGQTESRAETDRPGDAALGAEAAAAAVFLALLLTGIFLFQAALRRKRHRDEMAYTAEGNGIPAMYDMIIKTAETVSAGKSRKDSGNSRGHRRVRGAAGRSARGVTDELGEDRLTALKTVFSQIRGDEWDWFYEQVMRSLFYETDLSREEWKRAYRLCRRFSGAARAQMGPGKRLLCRYVYCINVFPLIEEKERKSKRRMKDDKETNTK